MQESSTVCLLQPCHKRFILSQHTWLFSEDAASIRCKLLGHCAECNSDSKRRQASDVACLQSALPAKCKCGSLKESCAVKGCPSKYCKDSQAIHNKDFKQCNCCNEIYCANHVDISSQCCECGEEFCYDSQCEYCYEPLCEICQSGDHPAICVFEQSQSLSPQCVAFRGSESSFS